MAELDTVAVETYTGGRLHRDDDETARLLAAALSAARRYCGWHVTPVRSSDEVTLDGPCSPLLVLPTLRLIELTGLSENGTDLDLDTAISVSRRGLVRKRGGCWWSGQYGAITVSMTHGFEEASDWQSAVLSFIDRSSLEMGGGREAVGPFVFSTTSMSVTSAFSDAERMILDLYKLESVA